MIHLEIQIPVTAPQIMILDQARLGTGRLWPYTGALHWVDLAEYTTQVTTWEGHRTDDPTLPVEAGNLAATLREAPDLAAMGAARQTPIRLRDDDGILWAGWIDKIRDTWDKATDTKTTRLTAYDLAAVLGSITRYGATHAAPEPLTDRLARLVPSSPVAITAVVDEDMGNEEIAAAECIPTVMETSLLRHFQMAATAASAFMRIDTDARQIILRQPARWWRIMFSLNIRGWDLLAVTDDPDSDLPSYFEVTLATPDETPTRLELVTHGIGDDDREETTTHVHINTSAELLYRPSTVTIDTVAPPEQLPQVAQFFAPAPGQNFQVSSVSTVQRVRHPANPGTTAWPLDGKRLRTLDTAAVTYRGQTYHSLITGIAHEISSDPYSTASDVTDGIRHRTTYTLTPRS